MMPQEKRKKGKEKKTVPPFPVTEQKHAKTSPKTTTEKIQKAMRKKCALPRQATEKTKTQA